jgi:hypothetical protein
MTPRNHRRSAPVLAGIAALTMLMTAALPASAASWSTPKKIAGTGTFWVDGVATENNHVVVSWLENASELVYRLSNDRGKTFGPRVDVGPAYNPAAVTLCGGYVAAIRGVGSTMVLDLRSVDGSDSASRTLATGRDLTETGNNIVCVGGRRLATFWDEWIGGVLHLKVAVVPVTEPLSSYEFDLGRAYLYRVRGIAATETAIWVAWSRGNGIVVQRLDVGTGPAMKVSKGPRVRIARSLDAPGAVVAAVGDRVYVGYQDSEDAFIRISKDGGQSFGRVIRVYDSTGADPASFFSLAARENVVVAATHLGPWCGGCVGSNMAVYSTNWGRTWTSGPPNVGGYSGVALLGIGPGIRIVHAWDNRTSHEAYGDPGFMKVQLGTP